MTLWSLGSLIVFPLKLQLAWCIARLPRRFGRNFKIDSLKVMDLGFINCRRTLLVFLKGSFLWVITSPIFQFCGMRYIISIHFIFVHVGSVYAMWMTRFLILTTAKRLCNFWWVLMTLSLRFKARFYLWILFHQLTRCTPC